MSPRLCIIPLFILFVSALSAQRPLTDRSITAMNSALSKGEWDRAMQLNDSVLYYTNMEIPNDTSMILWAYWMRVRIHLVRQEFEQCRKLIVNTLQTYEQQNAGKFHVRLHAELGSVYIGTKDLELAIQSFHAALTVSDSIDPITAGIIYESLAQAHMDLAEHDSALKYINIALRLDSTYQTINRSAHAGNIMYKALVLSHQGRFDEAERLGLLALQSSGLHHQPVGFSYMLSQMAAIYHGENHFEKALCYTLQADSIYRQNLDSSGWYFELLAEQGLYRLALGQSDSALTYFKAIPSLVKREMKSESSYLSVRGREVYADRNANMMDYLLTMMHRAPENQAYCAEVYDFLVFYKGFSMRSLKSLQQSIHRIDDPELSERHQRWIETRKNYYEHLSRGSDVDALRKDLEASERALFYMADSIHGGDVAEDSWVDVSRHLLSDEIAVEFVRFTDFLEEKVMRYAAIVIRPNARPEYIPLCLEKELTALIQRQFGETDFEFVHRLYEGNTRLYELIWEPLESHLSQGNRLYVSASGVLHRLSHDALKTHSGETLASTHQVVMVNSTANLPQQDRLLLEPNALDAVLYGGISYDIGETQQPMDAEAISMNVHLRYGDRLQANWQFLDYSEAEVKSIERILKEADYDCTLRTGVSATELALCADLDNGSPALVHIATHGLSVKKASQGAARSQSESYAQSGLVMAAANDCFKAKSTIEGFGDGILTGPEIASLNMLGTQLVVLSACESGLGEVSRTDEVFGLQRAFKIAGVDYILYTLWKVPDETTMEFMNVFYNNLSAGQPLDQAFAATKYDMQARYSVYYWAPFQLIY